MNRTRKNDGFTLMEIMIATSIAMVLLFGALYSTSETLGIVREGDAMVNTEVHARRALDRILKDFRYSAALAIADDLQEGWIIEVTTTGTLDPGVLTYSWNPSHGLLRVQSAADTETVLEDVRAFTISTLTETIGEDTYITRVSMEWTVGLDAGMASGAEQMNAERTMTLAGSTWIRRNDF